MSGLEIFYHAHLSHQERAALDLLQQPMHSLRVAVEVRRHIVRMDIRGERDVPVIAWAALATAVEDGALDKRLPDGRPSVPPGIVRMVRIACSFGGGGSVDLSSEMGGLDRHEAIAVAVAFATASDVSVRQLAAALDEQLVRESL